MAGTMRTDEEMRALPADVPITGDMLLRMKSEVRAIPLDSQYVPVGGIPLEDVSDEALLSCPPHLIAHIQRTASQGGLQVISPRQTPFSCMMVRRKGTQSMLGDHNVGSINDPTSVWPTVDGDDMARLLPDEPIAPRRDIHVVREKTRSLSLVKGGVELADPVIACLIKGRAIIDILRRADVSGGADEMAALLAHAWGIDVEDLMDLEGYSLGIEGDLQRHAIRSDDVYPVMYAPVQYSEVISCGVTDMTKSLLLPFTGVDWRRARVHCEVLFYNACRLEGLPINLMRGPIHPAHSGSSANKPNTMTFYPAPGIAWSFDPGSFSIMPDMDQPMKSRFSLPQEIREALQRYVTRVRPVSYLVATGQNVRTWQTTGVRVDQASGETLSSGYVQVVKSITTGDVRGKTAAAAVRNAIFEIMSTAPSSIGLRMARYIMAAEEECRAHLGVEIVPDSVVMDLSKRLVDVGSFIRAKLANEADIRKVPLEVWWSDLLSQAPAQYHKLKEGSHGWAQVAVWLLFRHPTDKWVKLGAAVRYEVMRMAERGAIGAVELPAERGSPQRLHAVVEYAVKGITTAYAGYYKGMYDVGIAVAKALQDSPTPKPRKYETVKEAAYLWAFRARCFRGMNVHLVAHDEPTPSKFHIRIPAEPADVLLKPAPYRGFTAWRGHMEKSKYIGTPIKKHFQKKGYAQITHYFRDLDRGILPAPATTLTRYLLEPHRLYADIEGAWAMLVEDIKDVIARFAAEQAPLPPVDDEPEVVHTDFRALMEASERTEEHRGLVSYWNALYVLQEDELDGVEDAVSRLPRELQDELTEGWYIDTEDMLRELTRLEQSIVEEGNRPSDMVR